MDIRPASIVVGRRWPEGGRRAHDQAMFTSILIGIAIVVVPTFLVLAALAVLGLTVAALADAVPNGLVRPSAS